jgi:hypothetical protein
MTGLQIGNAFPNPSNGLVSIPIEMAKAGTVAYELKNLQGQIQLRGKWDLGPGHTVAELQIPYQSTPGIYLLSIHTGDQTHTQKLVKY